MLLLIMTAGLDTALLPAGPEPSWGNDVLVWDMPAISTWIGPGIAYCDGSYTPSGILYAVSCADLASDLLPVYSSTDNGNTWHLANFITGGGWSIHGPRICISENDTQDYFFVYVASTSSTSFGLPMGFRFTLPDFAFDGFLYLDWSNPACDTIRSVAVARTPSSGQQWVFADDISNNLFLSISSDEGNTWTPCSLVAKGAARPSATAGPDGTVYVTYQETVGEGAIKCIAFGADTVSATIGTAAQDAAPIPAVEWAGEQLAGIVWHDASNNIMISLTDDKGATWSLPEPVGQGYYPFIDVFPGTRNCAMAYIDQITSRIKVASATGLLGLASATPVVRSDFVPTLYGPPIVRYGALPGIVALFYMGPGPQDIWYDNSYFLSSPESGPDSGAPGLHIFPNPASGMVSVAFSLAGGPGQVRLQVFDLGGRVIESLFEGTSSGESLGFSLEGLPAGVYSVVLTTPRSVASQRLVRL
jgi:hypothetical protein